MGGDGCTSELDSVPMAQRIAERLIRPQRRATCTHRYASKRSAADTCHPMLRNGIPRVRG